MKAALAQTRLKTADFEFNLNSIIEAAKNAYADLVIYPQADLADLGAKDLCLDEKCLSGQADFYQRLADMLCPQALLIGDVLIKDGEIILSEDGFFELFGKKIYVSDSYNEDVECDLYVLSKNSYFTIGGYKEFVENINVKSDFVYVNAAAMADCDIYFGGSFAKNRNNELIAQMPFCKEAVQTLDFEKPIIFDNVDMERQIIDVITFALREYCENAGFKKVLLGLSGGIDSALTAALAAIALGAENVVGVLMPSMYSSQGSIDDSLELAHNLGIKTIKHSITPLFDNFMDEVGHERLGDLAEENLQARLRALILMFFSNRGKYLVLSTGNKSESAMGFGTLYGDLAGGLNLICDLTKTNVYKISNYLNKDGEIIPQETIDKAPSAELHPGQKDQDRLPEYEVLDDIIELYVEQNRPLDEIYEKYNKELVDEIVRKIYRFQFKRKQSCLGVRLTERSFCCGCTLPIVQKFY